MKVALVIERMNPLRGGQQVYTAQLAGELIRRGHDVTVICAECDWQNRPDAVRVAALGREGMRRVTRLRNFVAAAQREMAAGGYDVVHAMAPVPGASVYHPHGGTFRGTAAAAMRRWSAAVRPAARLIRRLNALRRTCERLERQIVADEKALCVCVSEMVAEQFTGHDRLAGRTRVVFNGVDVPDPAGESRADWRQRNRYRLGVDPGDVVFLTVATNFPLKGVAECIVAFSRYSHARRDGTRARLVVVGREPPESYQRFAGIHDVGRQVLFVPPVRDVFEWYAAADVCMLLTWYDPCSLVTLEATRWGIPSITTAFNGAAEVLAGGGGVVVPGPKHTGRVVAAMHELSDPQRRAECREACLKVAGRLGMGRHVEELLEVYREAAGRR